MRTIRVFISSPSDVRAERHVAGRVLERLQGKYWSFVRLEDVFWETQVVRATRHYQEEIVQPAECEIVIGILWSRLGSPLPESFRNEAGDLWRSGTEWELEQAFAAYAASLKDTGDALKAKPDIVVYRRNAPRIAHDDPKLEAEAQNQEKALGEYLEEYYFHHDEHHTIKRPLAAYQTVEEFESKLEGDLERLVLRLIPGLKPGFDPPPISGCPFKGLETFDFQDGDRYFGRNREIRELQERFRRRATQRRPFVLIYGASGHGKSSLMRAGLAPAVTRAGGALPGMERWRLVLLQPGLGEGTLCERLARVLLAGADGQRRELSHSHAHLSFQGVPELSGTTMEENASAVWDVASLGRAFASWSEENQDDESKQASQAKVLRAITAIQHVLQQCDAYLLLQVDQLEEVYDGAAFAAEDREAFFRVIRLLCETRRVWAVATLRNELFPKIADEPELHMLLGEDGGYILPAPTRHSLREIIRHPALAARMEYQRLPQPPSVNGEEARSEFLDEQILSDAESSADALPLLSFTLRSLWDRLQARGGGDLLVWDDYAALMGLKGAIADTATHVYENLSAEAIAAGAGLFASFVQVDLADLRVARERVLRSSLSNTPGAAEFVSAFLKSSLLVSDSVGGQAVISLAHEALLTHWPVLRDWISDHRSDLLAHRRLADQTVLWMDHRKSQKFLLAEGRLAEAERVIESPALFSKVSKEERACVTASRQHARKRLRFFQAAALVFALVACLAVLFGYVAEQRKHIAQQREKEARVALASETLALSRSHYAKALQLITSGDTREAGAYLAKAHRLDPMDQACWCAMFSLLTDSPPLLPLGRMMRTQGNLDQNIRPQQSHDRRYLMVQQQMGIAVFDLKNGLLIHDAGSGTANGTWSGSFAPDGSGAIITSSDGEGISYFSEVPGVGKAAPFFNDTATGLKAALTGGAVRLTRNGDSLITVTAGQQAEALASIGTIFQGVDQNRNAVAYARDGTFQHELDLGTDSISVMAASPASDLFATGSDDGSLRVWNYKTGDLILSQQLSSEITGVIFTRDGSRMFTSGHEKRLRGYDLRTKREMFAADWAHELNDLSLSKDGTLLVVADDDGFSLVNPSTGARFSRQVDLDTSVSSVVMEANGQRVLAGTLGGSFYVADFAGGQSWYRKMTQMPGRIVFTGFGPEKETAVTFNEYGQGNIWPLSGDNMTASEVVLDQNAKTVHYSPDGLALMVTALNDDASVIYWHSLSGHRKPLRLELRKGKVLAGLWMIDDKNAIAVCVDSETLHLQIKNNQLVADPLAGTDFAEGRICMGAAYAVDKKILFVPRLDFMSSLPDLLKMAENLLNDQSKNRANFLSRVRSLMKSDLRVTLLGGEASLAAPDALTLPTGGAMLVCDREGETVVLMTSFGELHFLRKSANSWIPLLFEEASSAKMGVQTSETHVGKLALSADGSTLLEANTGNKVLVYKIADSVRKVMELQTRHEVSAVAVTPDGSHIAFGDEEGVLRIMNTATGTDVGSNLGHEGSYINSLTFSRDGQWLLSAGNDEKAKLWHVATGRLAAKPLKGRGDINDAQFSPDERMVALAQDQKSVAIHGVGIHCPAPPSWVPELLEVLAGFRIGNDGQQESIEEELSGWRERLQAYMNDGWWGEVAAGLIERDRRLAPGVPYRLSEEYRRRAEVNLQGEDIPMAMFYAHRAKQVNPEQKLSEKLEALASLGQLSETQAMNIAPSEHKAGEMKKASCGLSLRWCPPARFLAGSPYLEEGRGNNESQHHVIFPDGFWMAQTETTQKQWREIMGSSAREHAKEKVRKNAPFRFDSKDPKKITTVGSFHSLVSAEDLDRWTGFFEDELPVTFVNWEDANEFCRRLTLHEKEAGALPPGWSYRLPTEAEWEFACRAGTATATYEGTPEYVDVSNAPMLNGLGWYAGNSSVDYSGSGWGSSKWQGRAFTGEWAGAHRVGLLKANAWGLQDMLGNVSEWCVDASDGRDFYRHVYVAPREVGGSWNTRMCKGGSWRHFARSLRAAFRFPENEEWCSHIMGFRVALVKEEMREDAPTPEAFHYSYNFEPDPGLRVWTQKEEGVWVETSPSGTETRFVELRHAEVRGDRGVLLRRQKQTNGVWEDDGDFEVFFHLPGAKEPAIYFRSQSNPDWANWGRLGSITFGSPE